ncbi:Lipopolysaccharide heptosyltransferase 1 [Candidatus Hartigia pinicola]|nr:Lipopolysaccharide heptosyltransferase 1 [Candidatus Hartigia pinicola]
MRVLLVKTSSMGDVIHSLPALTDAQKALPGIQFDWVVEEKFSQIPTWHSAVNQVIPVAIRRWRKHWFTIPIRAERSAFRQQLKVKQYDAIIDAQGLLKSAFLVTRLTNGPKHGYNHHTIREPISQLFYDHCYHICKQQHAIERIRQLFSSSLNYSYLNHQVDYGIAQNFLYSSSNHQNTYILFLHSTTRNDKHWPEECWRILIKLLASSSLKIKLPWGEQYEYQRAIRLSDGFNFVEVLPKLTLEEIAQHIIHAKVIVSVDTGLSQLTAALNKNNLTLFGPTNPDLIGGYGQGQNGIKSADNRMESITPKHVFQQLKKIIKNI